MTVTNDKPTGFFVPIPVALESVLARLDVLSRQPEFARQRETGLARALKPYLNEGGGVEFWRRFLKKVNSPAWRCSAIFTPKTAS